MHRALGDARTVLNVGAGAGSYETGRLELPPLDLCLICVKEFDLAPALSRLEPLVGDKTIVLPLLNGVDVYSRLTASSRRAS